MVDDDQAAMLRASMKTIRALQADVQRMTTIATTRSAGNDTAAEFEAASASAAAALQAMHQQQARLENAVDLATHGTASLSQDQWKDAWTRYTDAEHDAADHLTDAASVDQIVEWAASMTGKPITLHSAFATTPTTDDVPPHHATEIRMRIADDLVAVVALQSPGACHAARVGVCAAHELPTAHGWYTSSYTACQRASAVAMAALQHFDQHAGPQHAAPLRHLLIWLATLQDLYTTPSVVTGELLAQDPALRRLVPPVYRPYALSLKQLLARVAQGRHGEGACHLQDVLCLYPAQR